MAKNGHRGENHWGPPPAGEGPGGRWFKPGTAVGGDTLGEAIGDLHSEHPHPVQGEGLHHMGVKGRHHPVTSSTYRGGKVD